MRAVGHILRVINCLNMDVSVMHVFVFYPNIGYLCTNLLMYKLGLFVSE